MKDKKEKASKKDPYTGKEYDKSLKDHQRGEMAEEIREKVLAKALSQVETQAKEIEELKKENVLLKNHLTYILKRIILNKNDFNTIIKNNKMNNINSVISMNNSMIVKGNTIGSNGSILKPLKSVENYRCITENNIFDDNDENHKNSSVDNKVSSYLNSLYRNNFTHNNGLSDKFFLNKNQSLFDELFGNKNKIPRYLKTESDFPNAGKRLHSQDKIPIKTQRSMGSSVDKKRNNRAMRIRNYINKSLAAKTNYEENKKDSTLKSIGVKKNYKTKSRYLDTSNSLKKRTKDHSYLDTHNYRNVNNNDGDDSTDQNIKSNSHLCYGTSNNYSQKNKPRGVLYLKRSPFLANKF